MKQTMTVNSFLKIVQHFLIYAFIVLAPINKAIEYFVPLPVSLLLVVTMMLFLVSFLEIITSNETQLNPYKLLIVFVFGFELIVSFFSGTGLSFGLIIFVLLFLLFFNYKGNGSLFKKRVYLCFYLSSIFSSIFSLYFGFIQQEIVRTATIVDGGIAVSTICVAFYLDDENNNTFKLIGSICCLITLLLGMSRARIIIVLSLIVFRLFLHGKTFAFTKKRVQFFLLFFLISIVTIVLFRDRVFSVANVALERFQYGLSSEGRAFEIRIGLEYFKNKPFEGAGWGEIQYVDYQDYLSNYDNHNMFVAILARGGLLFAIPVFLTFAISIIQCFKNKAFLALMPLILILVLGYGNGGFFNYTNVCLLLLHSLNSSTYTFTRSCYSGLIESPSNFSRT